MSDARHVGSGKVRELYEVGDDRLLLVASDRVSAYDVVLPQAIPDKGKVLTGLSHYWFEVTEGICPNQSCSKPSCSPVSFKSSAFPYARLIRTGAAS